MHLTSHSTIQPMSKSLCTMWSRSPMLSFYSFHWLSPMSARKSSARFETIWASTSDCMPLFSASPSIRCSLWINSKKRSTTSSISYPISTKKWLDSITLSMTIFLSFIWKAWRNVRPSWSIGKVLFSMWISWPIRVKFLILKRSNRLWVDVTKDTRIGNKITPLAEALISFSVRSQRRSNTFLAFLLS